MGLREKKTFPDAPQKEEYQKTEKSPAAGDHPLNHSGGKGNTLPPAFVEKGWGKKKRGQRRTGSGNAKSLRVLPVGKQGNEGGKTFHPESACNPPGKGDRAPRPRRSKKKDSSPSKGYPFPTGCIKGKGTSCPSFLAVNSGPWKKGRKTKRKKISIWGRFTFQSRPSGTLGTPEQGNSAPLDREGKNGGGGKDAGLPT